MIAAYSQRSRTSVRGHPATFLRSAEMTGWTSLFVQELVLARETSGFAKPATEDATLIVQIAGSGCLEVDRGEGRQRFERHPGSIGFAPGEQAMVVGWRRIGRHPLRVVHVYLPQAIMAAAEDEFRLAGRAAARMPFLTIRDLDPVIHAVTGQLLDAIDGQQPDIYAQSAAHFLAAHLQTVHRFTSAGDMRAVTAPADLRIARVVDRMRSELERPLGIDELAREACVSPFHFSRLFKAATGIAPARYLTELRMKRAAVLLENEADMPIGTIAVACGYSNAAAFTTAFRRWSGNTPREWRSRVRGPVT